MNHDDYDEKHEDSTPDGEAPAEVYQPIEPEPQRTFEDLTLAEALGQWIRSPRTTTNELVEIVRTPTYVERTPTIPATVPKKTTQVATTPQPKPVPDAAQWREWIRTGLYLLAFALALYGNLEFIDSDGVLRSEDNQLARGLPFVIMGFMIWLGAEVFWSWEWIKARFSRKTGETKAGTNDVPNSTQLSSSFSNITFVRLAYFIAAIFFSILTYIFTSNNTFTFGGAISWISSIVLIVLAFAPLNARPLAWLREKNDSIKIQITPTVVAFVLIMLLGAYFRFDNFSNTPPEMTSDHVEKILDAQRVFNGDYDVFFANNGGREPFQMYAIALLSNLPGLGMNHATLQFLAIVEALITLPVLWWMGREVIGERDRRLGNIVGLTLMALVAASYWHTSITRLALRIVLTPLVASLIVIYLGRAMRHNRRVDYIICGLILGFGLYTYQAVRMLPIMIVIGVFFAFLFQARNRRDRLHYVTNLTVLVIVSAVVFMPLFRYWNQYPESFWQRTAGRLLGDSVIVEYDEEGNIVGERNATIDERFEAFGDNMSALASNVRNALLMYNWKGDVAWINGAPNHPQMDPLTGALLIVGVAAWLALLVRWRDSVILLIPVMIFIMLLPSALSIAMPIENPSATRTSGSLPPAYLIAGFGLAMLALSLRRALGGKVGGLASTFFVTVVILGAYIHNSDTYFNEFQESYLNSSLPYSEAGQILEGFAQSDGTYGNAFVIAYQHWWDHRAVGIEAGITDWTNGVAVREELPEYMYDAWRCGDNTHRLNPDRDLLFFFHQDDGETSEYLFNLFPEGRVTLIDSYQENDEYWIFRAPALTSDGMVEFDETYVSTRRC